MADAMSLMARDLLRALDSETDPACTAQDGRWTIEMVQAVYASSLAGGTPVSLPLADRRHPLA
jgi:hypothetical protein